MHSLSEPAGPRKEEPLEVAPVRSQRSDVRDGRKEALFEALIALGWSLLWGLAPSRKFRTATNPRRTDARPPTAARTQVETGLWTSPVEGSFGADSGVERAGGGVDDRGRCWGMASNRAPGFLRPDAGWSIAGFGGGSRSIGVSISALKLGATVRTRCRRTPDLIRYGVSTTTIRTDQVHIHGISPRSLRTNIGPHNSAGIAKDPNEQSKPKSTLQGWKQSPWQTRDSNSRFKHRVGFGRDVANYTGFSLSDRRTCFPGVSSSTLLFSISGRSPESACRTPSKRCQERMARG